MLSVLNDELVSSGKATFILPIRSYANGGKNSVMMSRQKRRHTAAGFPAVKGWDAVSGFGTPSMAVLREVLTQSCLT